MANVQKRVGKNGTSYRIRVSCGYDINGNQIFQSTTWKVPKGLTTKQEQKELQTQIQMFEEKCKSCEMGGNIRFITFAEQWFSEYATTQLKESSRNRYAHIAPEVYQALGNLKIDEITPRHIQTFLTSLQKRGNKKTGKPLSARTIEYHLIFISVVMKYAVMMGLIKENPCSRVLKPKKEQKEKQIYTLEEAQRFLDALNQNANLKYRAFYTLAVFSGFRLGEMLGLEWKDIDFQNQTIEIKRTSNYTTEKGQYDDTPKTKKSARILRLPQIVFETLQEYRKEQNHERFAMGERWIFTDRVFTGSTGKTLSYYCPRQWLVEFCKKNNLPYYGVHSFRHLNATLLIESGANIKTVSSALGHSQVTTTLNIYAHEVASAQAKASEALADMIHLKTKSS